MIQIVCSVYDSKAKAFCVPFFVNALGLALRAFQGEANNPESQLGAYPEDFTLFELGTFSDVDGTFKIHPQPINHGLAANYREPSHVRQNASQSVGHETLVLAGTKGGDSA